MKNPLEELIRSGYSEIEARRAILKNNDLMKRYRVTKNGEKELELWKVFFERMRASEEIDIYFLFELKDPFIFHYLAERASFINYKDLFVIFSKMDAELNEGSSFLAGSDVFLSAFLRENYYVLQYLSVLFFTFRRISEKRSSDYFFESLLFFLQDRFLFVSWTAKNKDKYSALNSAIETYGILDEGFLSFLEKKYEKLLLNEDWHLRSKFILDIGNLSSLKIFDFLSEIMSSDPNLNIRRDAVNKMSEIVSIYRKRGDLNFGEKSLPLFYRELARASDDEMSLILALKRLVKSIERGD